MFTSVDDIYDFYPNLFEVDDNKVVHNKEDTKFILALFSNKDTSEIYDENNHNHLLWKGLYEIKKENFDLANSFFKLGLTKYNCMFCMYYTEIIKYIIENKKTFNEFHILAIENTITFAKDLKNSKKDIEKWNKENLSSIICQSYQCYAKNNELKKIRELIEMCEILEEKNINLYKYNEYMLLRNKDKMEELENNFIENKQYEIIREMIQVYLNFKKNKKVFDLIEKYKNEIPENVMSEFRIHYDFYSAYLNAGYEKEANEYLNENYNESYDLYKIYCKKYSSKNLQKTEEIVKLHEEGFEKFKKAEMYSLLSEYFIKKKNDEEIIKYLEKGAEYLNKGCIIFLINYYTRKGEIHKISKYINVGLEYNISHCVNAYIIIILNKISPNFGYKYIYESEEHTTVYFKSDDEISDYKVTHEENDNINKYYNIVSKINNNMIFKDGISLKIFTNIFWYYLKTNNEKMSKIIYEKNTLDNNSTKKVIFTIIYCMYLKSVNKLIDAKQTIIDNINSECENISNTMLLYQILFTMLPDKNSPEYFIHMKNVSMSQENSVSQTDIDLINSVIDTYINKHFEYFDDLIKKDEDIKNLILENFSRLIQEYKNEKNKQSENAIKWNKKNTQTYIYTLNNYVIELCYKYLKKIMNPIESINYLKNNCNQDLIPIKKLINLFESSDQVKYYKKNSIPVKKECPICFEENDEIVGLNCTIEHYLCTDCYFKSNKCPFKCGVDDEEKMQEEFQNIVSNIFGMFSNSMGNNGENNEDNSFSNNEYNSLSNNEDEDENKDDDNSIPDLIEE